MCIVDNEIAARIILEKLEFVLLRSTKNFDIKNGTSTTLKHQENSCEKIIFPLKKSFFSFVFYLRKMKYNEPRYFCFCNI